ncbi:vacuolar protein sorting-associated protein 3 [Marchantia polymorpha subsp. ruderalis]|uniref:CNH domain-containing protein n=2 Tax=Marchantia polymorpha TaxID=3197 RepID=A0AAF6AK69_MARPO|nr:hypothetical protein MARPO_0029s0138 [Marchantia polymorpha]BBM96839.1 hypothetical protein Mp_1g01080 [Marchantia polymorpha subsp. ruderalis]|eukprot:PTQ42644.1 hypothetical protein MARPO_0029s0138 [Marchantia polymorpha]
MEESWSKGGERVAVRVELDAIPLKDAPIPPCRLQSIAICKGSDDSFVLYVGTESGHVLRYALSSPISVDSSSNSPSQTPPQQLSTQHLPPPPPLSLPPAPTPLKGPLTAASSLIDIPQNSSGELSPPRVHGSSPSNDLFSVDHLVGSPALSSPGAPFSPPVRGIKAHGRSQNGTLSGHSPSHSPLRQSSQFLPPHTRPVSASSSSNRPSSAPQASSSSSRGVHASSPSQSGQYVNHPTSGARPLSSPSSPMLGALPSNCSPFSFSSPQISSLSGEHENGSSVNSPYARPSSPIFSASSILDPRAAYKPSLEMTLTLCKHVSKHPIESLCALPECGRIAFLSDGQISLLGSESLNVVDRLNITKGAVTLARGLPTSFSSLSDSLFPSSRDVDVTQKSRAIVIRNEMTMKSLFGRGKISSRLGGLVGGLGEAFATGKGEVAGRISSRSGRLGAQVSQTQTGVRVSQTFARLAVALRKKVILFEIRPVEQDWIDRRENLVKDDSNNSAVVKVRELTGIEGIVTMAWLGDVIIAGTRQEYLLISLATGLPTHLFSLPQELSWRPLLKAFPKDRQALLLIDNAGIPINTEGHPAGGSLQFQMVPDGIGFSTPYVVVVKQGVVELYHHKTGTKMQSLSLLDAGKGKSLVADDDDGQYVVIANSFKVWCLRQVPLEEQLKELLKNKSYSDAIRLAEDSQVEGGEEKTKFWLSMVHAETGFLHLFDLHFKEAMDHFLLSDILEPAELFPFFPSMTSRWRAMVPRKRYWGLHPPPQPMVMVIESGLLAIKSGLLAQTQLLGGDGSKSEDLYLGTKSGKDALVERYLILAMQNVARYLNMVREEELKALEKEAVDTFLMKLYTELHATSELEELASSSNRCVLEEVENLLKGAGQLRALALLYESKKLWNLALQVWQTLAHTPYNSWGSANHQVGNLSYRQVAAATEAARLLEESSDSKLVLLHLSWILKLDQNLALNVLTSSKREDPLPAEDALELLKAHGGIVQQRYLLWLVREQGSEDPHYHTELALSLAKSALGALGENIGHMEDSGSTASSSRQAHLSHTRHECPQTQLDASVSPSSLAMINNPREQLLTFLESSDHYDAKAVLDHIQESELWKEQFVLHRKLGDELSALRTLALKLEDSEAAEQYCAEIGRPDIYSELMNMYLNPGEGRVAMHRAAVSLLHCPGAYLDPMQLLKALTLDMPLSLASETISQMLVSRVHRHRQGQIVRQMNRKENLEARIARVEERSRHVCITADTVCGSCNARIGTKLFALYPNDMIFCYKCLRQYGERMHPAIHR